MSLQVTGQAQGIVLTTSQKSGAPSAVSTGWHNELVKSDLLPKYAYLTLSGLVYSTTYAVAATAAASATATGSFSLFNPAGSGKNLVLLDAQAFINAPAASTTTYAAGFVLVPNQTPTAQTPGTTPANLLAGAANASVAKPLTAGTLVGAPTVVARIPFSWYADLAASDLTSQIEDQIDGRIVIAPNSMVNLVSFAGTPSVGLSLTWAELPV